MDWPAPSSSHSLTHPPIYSLFQALAVAAGVLDPYYKPRFENTTPVAKIGPFPQWWVEGEGGLG
jgi:hypothetical protein